jgi:peroxiredoxin
VILLRKGIRSTILIVIVAITLYTLWMQYQQKDAGRLTVGEKAPEFTLTTLDGRTVSLSDYRGQGVLLNFWGTWCPPCRAEMPALQRQYEANKDHGFVVLAIDMNEPAASVQGFVNQYGLTFPILMDKGEVARAYQIDPLPTTVLVNPEGIVVKIIAGEMEEHQIAEYVKLILPSP